jgi:hypothetical protein
MVCRQKPANRADMSNTHRLAGTVDVDGFNMTGNYEASRIGASLTAGKACQLRCLNKAPSEKPCWNFLRQNA